MGISLLQLSNGASDGSLWFVASMHTTGLTGILISMEPENRFEVPGGFSDSSPLRPAGIMAKGFCYSVVSF